MGMGLKWREWREISVARAGGGASCLATASKHLKIQELAHNEGNSLMQR